MKLWTKTVLFIGVILTLGYAETKDSTACEEHCIKQTTQTPPQVTKKYTTGTKSSTTSTNWSKIKDLFL